MMQPPPVAPGSPQTRRVLIAVVVGCLYISIFLCASGTYLIKDAIQPPHRKVFTSDGQRLYVADIVSGKTNSQIFAQKPLLIDGEDSYASNYEGKIFVQLGDQTIWWKGKKVGYPVWSLKTQSVFFLVPEPNEDRNRTIWKWSKPTGFVQVSKKPIKDLYYLRVSLDQRSLVAMIYSEDASSVFTCDLDGGNQKILRQGPYNFDPVMVDHDRFLLNKQKHTLGGIEQVREIEVVEWSSKSNKEKPLKVGTRVADGVIAFNGSVWVLFQRKTVNYYPWMIARGEDEITVGKLSPDLTRVIEEIKLTGTHEELWEE